MFEELKRKIGHYLLRRRFLRKEIKPSSFNNVISNAKDLFIVMPRDDRDFFNSLDILKYYQIHRKSITLFLPEHKYGTVPEKEKYRFISFQAAVKKTFNLPDKNMVRRLEGKEFEIVIDLNRSEDLFSSAVCNIVNSKVRVGFARERSELYYSLQIAGNQGDPEVSYRNFLNYLKMF
ncbi:MAG: hypothetical protein WC061_06920 [Melioribacteraceae bacterium]